MGVSFYVKPLLVGEHTVPDVAAAAEGLFKEFGLLRRGIEPDPNGVVLIDTAGRTGAVIVFFPHWPPASSSRLDLKGGEILKY